MADEKRIATFEWLNSSLYDFRKGTPPNNKKGVTKNELITNYSVNESLLSSYTSNQLIPRGKCVGLSLDKYYFINIKGATDSDVDQLNNKILIGGSIFESNTNIGMKYEQVNITNGTVESSTQLNKIVRLNSNLSIDSTFIAPSLIGDVRKVTTFANGNILVETSNISGNETGGGRYPNYLYILGQNGNIINEVNGSLGMMNQKRDKVAYIQKGGPIQTLNIMDNQGNVLKVVLNNTDGADNSEGCIAYGDNLLVYTKGNNSTDPTKVLITIYDVSNINNITEFAQYTPEGINPDGITNSEILKTSIRTYVHGKMTDDSVTMTVCLKTTSSSVPANNNNERFVTYNTTIRYTGGRDHGRIYGNLLKSNTKTYNNSPSNIIQLSDGTCKLYNTISENGTIIIPTSAYAYNCNFSKLQNNVKIHTAKYNNSYIKIEGTHILNFAVYKNNIPSTSYP